MLDYMLEAQCNIKTRYFMPTYNLPKVFLSNHAHYVVIDIGV